MTVTNMIQTHLAAALTAVRSDTRMAGRVVRYHTWPFITRQDVSQHSWQVWRIVRAIWGNRIPWDVTEQIMLHDCGELRTGDAPYPIKRDNPELKKVMDRLEETALAEQGVWLTSLDSLWKWRIKVAHTIEMMETGMDELAAGSAFGSTVVMQMAEWLPQQLAAFPGGYPDADVAAVNAYVADRARRFVDLHKCRSDALAHLHTKAVTPPADRGEPQVPGTPADGGHHSRQPGSEDAGEAPLG